MKVVYRFLFVCAFLIGCSSTGSVDDAEENAYLFSSFRGNGEDGLHLAYSHDGLHWVALKNDQSFLMPKIGGKLMRDPCIIQGPEGRFHMVWTTGWTDQGIGIAHSEDLLDWSEQAFVPVMEHEPTARNSWAPEIFWDNNQGRYFIYWASTIPEKFTETVAAADKGWNHRIYYTTTGDFENYSETELFFQPGFNVIDSTIVKKDDEYIMVLKDETRYPPSKNLLISRSKSISGPWSPVAQPFTPKDMWVEGPTALKVNGWYFVYYDEYINHNYGAMRTKDFIEWELVSDKLDFPKGSRHGTAIPVSLNVLRKLLEEGSDR